VIIVDLYVILYIRHMTVILFLEYHIFYGLRRQYCLLLVEVFFWSLITFFFDGFSRR